MTHDNFRPNDALGTKVVDGSGEDARVARIAPAPVDFEQVVEARSHLLGEGQERGAWDEDDEVRQTG
ncbi:MAG: hypothetical protein IT320_06320 [Anaerolineae bacterium]|nr:hypothetical protein [Anaerolineae bacterium]